MADRDYKIRMWQMGIMTLGWGRWRLESKDEVKGDKKRRDTKS